MQQEILMTPTAAMQFLVWSFYYHGILPERAVSYGSYNKFAPRDVDKLDQLKAFLFKCFDDASVWRCCEQLTAARNHGEPCPFTQDMLDTMFAREVAQ